MDKFLRKFDTIRFVAPWSIFRNFLKFFHFFEFKFEFWIWAGLIPGQTETGPDRFPPVWLTLVSNVVLVGVRTAWWRGRTLARRLERLEYCGCLCISLMGKRAQSPILLFSLQSHAQAHTYTAAHARHTHRSMGLFRERCYLEDDYCSITVSNHQLITVIKFISKSYAHP